jgi:hypothetical protein|tara:strand:- start:265 stop:924 length:660 start_codon:yes stop_codon:yes gene_type:complete
MTLLIAISIAFAVLAFFFLFRMLHCMRRRRVLRACGSSLSCLMCAAIAGAGSILILSYLTYSRLIDEQLISRIEFEKTANDEYQARLMITGESDQFFTLRGDEWQMDARIVTWKPPLTVLGLDPIYQLDRLSGRFAEIDREQTEMRTVYSLTLEAPADLWRFTRRFPQLMPGVDAHYGTATFVPMSDGARYEVSLSRDALIARPANDAARTAIGTWRTH